MGRSNISGVLNDFFKRRIRTNNIGIYSIYGEEKEAVDAADAAFNNGQGVWPTMKVADRIKSMTFRYSNGGYSRRGGEVFDGK
jgi:hypothetical protein